MTILRKYFGAHSWVMEDGNDIVVVKLPPAQILFASQTTMAELGLWMASLLPGESFDIQNRERLLGVLFQKDGKQHANIFKIIPSKQFPLGDMRIIICESANVFPPVKQEEFEKIYVNKLILKMAEEYQSLKRAFLEARYEELFERLDQALSIKEKQIAFSNFFKVSPSNPHPNSGKLHIGNSPSLLLVN